LSKIFSTPHTNFVRANYGGYGFGFRRFISPKNEMVALENEEKMLEEELAAIREEKKPSKTSKSKRRRGTGPFVKRGRVAFFQ
jgi:hypothetical protein